FQDRKTGRALGTDPKQHDSVSRFLAARTQDGAPALLMPEGQARSLTTELIVPRTLDGRATLLRPASLKTYCIGGCSLVQMRPTGAAGAGGGLSEPLRKLLYFCGDHFVEVDF